MKDTLIIFETAKLAKEKRFNYHCDAIFDDDLTEVNVKDRIALDFFERFVQDYHDSKAYRGNDAKDEYLLERNSFVDTYTLRPTQSLLQRWLREVHGIYLLVDMGINRDYHWKYFNNQSAFTYSEGSFTSYEAALEKGLKEVLKLI